MCTVLDFCPPPGREKKNSTGAPDLAPLSIQSPPISTGDNDDDVTTVTPSETYAVHGRDRADVMSNYQVSPPACTA